MSDQFPEFSTDELVTWLQAKYRRHGEVEDGVAAERLKALTTEGAKLERIRKAADALWRLHTLVEGGLVPGDSELWNGLENALLGLPDAASTQQSGDNTQSVGASTRREPVAEDIDEMVIRWLEADPEEQKEPFEKLKKSLGLEDESE